MKRSALQNKQAVISAFRARKVLGTFEERAPGEGARVGFFWRAGLVAGLQGGRTLWYSGCLGLGSAVPVPHVPGHPTSICDEGVNCY